MLRAISRFLIRNQSKFNFISLCLWPFISSFAAKNLMEQIEAFIWKYFIKDVVYFHQFMTLTGLHLHTTIMPMCKTISEYWFYDMTTLLLYLISVKKKDNLILIYLYLTTFYRMIIHLLAHVHFPTFWRNRCLSSTTATAIHARLLWESIWYYWTQWRQVKIH